MQVDELAYTADGLPSSANELSRPLLIRLQSAKEKGIKKGLIYAPRLSWIFGSLLVALGLLIAGVTILTVVLGRRKS